jgi:hypothetical protein
MQSLYVILSVVLSLVSSLLTARERLRFGDSVLDAVVASLWWPFMAVVGLSFLALGDWSDTAQDSMRLLLVVIIALVPLSTGGRPAVLMDRLWEGLGQDHDMQADPSWGYSCTAWFFVAMVVVAGVGLAVGGHLA